MRLKMKPVIMVLIALLYLSPQVSGAQASSTQSKNSASKKVRYRKVQNINFDGEEINGMKKTPMSSYLLQNKVMKFLPLYKVKNRFKNDLKKSLQGLR